MSPPLRVCMVLVALGAHVSVAGTVNGKLELPPAPERPAVAARGFLDRVENPLTPVKPVNVGPQLVVVLEPSEPKEAPGQINWDLAGESFTRPVLAVPVGAEVIIRNTSKMPRTLVAVEDAKLIQGGPINPTGTRSVRAATAQIYSVVDRDAPHLRGKLVVVPTPYIAYVEVTGLVGKFELEVPEGSYKLRVFYRDSWIQRADETVTVPPPKGRAKSEVAVSVKIPPGYPTATAPSAPKK